MDQEERTERNRWLGKGDQSSQNWSFTITVQAANSSTVSKAGSFGWNNELPRTFSFPYLAILSKRLVDWLARMPGLPRLLGLSACRACRACLALCTLLLYFLRPFNEQCGTKKRTNACSKYIDTCSRHFFYTWVSFLFNVQISMVCRVKENLERGQEEI